MQTLLRHTVCHPQSARSHTTLLPRTLYRSLRVRAVAEPDAPPRSQAPAPSSSWYGGSGAPGSARGYADGASGGPPPFNGGGSPPAGTGSEPRLVSTNFSVYKGKSAMQLKMIPPTWGANSNNSRFLDVQRDGVILLEFALIAPGQGSQGSFGARSYAWDHKINFSLKAMEASQVAVLSDGSRGVDMVHDPNKGGADEGKVMKSFKVSAANPDGSHFFTVSQRSQGTSEDQRISVPVTAAEMATIRILLQWAVPKLLGFDAVFDNMKMAR